MTLNAASSSTLIQSFGSRRQWVNWRREVRKGRQTKVPYQPNGQKAESDNPATWATFEEVQRAAARFDGLGIVFTSDKLLLGVDLDHVLNTVGGIVSADAMLFVESADTYTEVSPSGDGLHVFLQLSEPLELQRNRSGDYECYTNKRFFTVTGISYHDDAKPLRTVSPLEAIALLQIIGYPWKDKPSANGKHNPLPTTNYQLPTADDELIKRISASKQAAKFDRLMSGDTTGFASPSEADSSLCCILAWWTKDAAQIERIWLSSGLGNREKTADREDYRQRTIAHALSSVTGQYEPRGLRNGNQGTGMDDAPKEKNAKQPRPTDDELAAVWHTRYPQTRYGLGDFRRYANGWWASIPDPKAESEIASVLEDAKPLGVRPTAGLLASVKKLAQVKAYTAIDDWDSNADVLVCKNGTLHIPSMTLREWRADDLMTSAVSYDYAPNATCPTFLKSLSESVPDARDLLQEFAGYALTTDTKHETALWLYGPGGCGKSTIIEGFQAMLGPGKSLSLGLADIENNRFALSKLPGKTLAISTEQPGGLVRATDTLNKIVSGEVVTVEQKYKDSYEIRSRAKLLWAMNELPRVANPNDGLFRRVKVIRFPPRDEKDRDPLVKEAIKQEGAGILNWALAGLQRLRARGRFLFPQSVKDATDNFQKHNDIPAEFVASCCTVGRDFKAQSQVLYDAYKTWCIQTNHKPQSSTTIADEWERLGFDRYEANGKKFWRGVGVNAVYNVNPAN